MSTHAEPNTLLSSLKLRFVTEDEFDEATAALKKDIFSHVLSIPNRALYSEDDLRRSEANSARYAQLESVYVLLMHNGRCIGWHYGFQEGAMTYYMCNSAIISEYRRQGCYSWLAEQVMKEMQARGYLKIKSRHHPTNTAVLIAKLKLGFIVSGLQVSSNFGTLVELEWHGNAHVEDVMKFRCGAAMPDASTLEVLGLSLAPR